jgi:hypothetical protein
VQAHVGGVISDCGVWVGAIYIFTPVDMVVKQNFEETAHCAHKPPPQGTTIVQSRDSCMLADCLVADENLLKSCWPQSHIKSK